ncbi:UNVERIFIED_CONTAM: hypothetical protein FKN15_013111 [Acipenser sinensis]
MRCFNCGAQGHIRRNCKKGEAGARSREEGGADRQETGSENTADDVHREGGEGNVVINVDPAPYVPVYPVIEYPRDNTEEALLDRRYDAYVIYPKENLQESSQEKIRHFINQDLPNILERKYDYHLFICGRDDLPGEDTAVAIEQNIINSKRLIIILTPGTSFGMKSENAYDQQLGLYNALVHDEMKVILIEMENFSSYKDLPESLQHIIQKRKTLKWNGVYGLRTAVKISVPDVKREFTTKQLLNYSMQKLIAIDWYSIVKMMLYDLFEDHPDVENRPLRVFVDQENPLEVFPETELRS